MVASTYQYYLARAVKHQRSLLFIFLLVVTTFFGSNQAIANASNVQHSKPLRIAVATNFLPALQKIIPKFEQEYAVKVQLISAASGVLFQQIRYGAPFDVFLSADAEKPQLLFQENLTAEHAPITYALGQLALFSKTKQLNTKLVSNACSSKGEYLPDSISCYLTTLSHKNQSFAIANPKLAPYGLAAKQALITMNVWPIFQSSLILGANVGQTFQQLRSKVVTHGIVAHAQLVLNELPGIILPQSIHKPIEQQLVIMKSSKQRVNANNFVDFLLSEKVQLSLSNMGYLPAQKKQGLQHERS